MTPWTWAFLLAMAGTEECENREALVTGVTCQALHGLPDTICTDLGFREESPQVLLQRASGSRSLAEEVTKILDGDLSEGKVYASLSGKGASKEDPLWGLDRIDQNNPTSGQNRSPPAFGTGKRAKVYVADSGVDRNSRFLRGRVKPPISIVSCGRGKPCHPHGTRVASVIAGKTIGVAPAATIVPVDILDSKNDLCVGDLYEALREVILRESEGLGAILNLSVEITVPGVDAPEERKKHFKDWLGWLALFEQQIAQLRSEGVITVVAAGNEAQVCEPTHTGQVYCGDLRDLHPSAIIVGSIDYRDEVVAPPPGLETNIALFAPGQHIATATPGSNIPAPRGGTSFAAAFVSGTLAVDLAHSRKWESCLEPEERAEYLKKRMLGRVNTQKVDILCARSCPTQYCPDSSTPADGLPVPPCEASCCWEGNCPKKRPRGARTRSPGCSRWRQPRRVSVDYDLLWKRRP